MSISVRLYLEADRFALQQLMTELGYSLNDDEMVDHIREIRAKDGEVFVAEVAGSVVGCICAIIDVRLAAGKYGELVSLTVTRNYQGSGIGTILVRHGESWLRTRVNKIRVRANTIRNKAHGFYEALDYKPIKSQKIFIKEL